MDRKLIIIIVIGILSIAIVPLGWTQLQDANSTLQNNTTLQNETIQNDIIQNDKPSTEAMGIHAAVYGPGTAKEGQNITIEYTISNKGTETVYDVRVKGQSIEKSLGTLKAGETKKFIEIHYIPTEVEVVKDYKPGSTVSNPYPVGGDAVYFKDMEGIKHIINFSRIEIKLT